MEWPYALLFLEWEARYPLEWTQHAKAWGTKETLIRKVARAPLEEAINAKLTDLVELVVHRAYRCKDREYVRVARAVDSADLRGRLDRAAGSDSPWARCHAGYVLWLLDHPDIPNTRRVWRTWVAKARLRRCCDQGRMQGRLVHVIMECSTPRDLYGRPCLPTHHP